MCLGLFGPGLRGVQLRGSQLKFFVQDLLKVFHWFLLHHVVLFSRLNSDILQRAFLEVLGSITKFKYADNDSIEKCPVMIIAWLFTNIVECCDFYQEEVESTI
ncbi:hypothetical protein Droror1_Dr00016211 [Drosera rotundifolia]